MTLLAAFAAERRAAAPGCGAAAARRPALSIDIFCAYGAQQQTHRTPLLRSIVWDRLTDGQTDGRTPDRFIDPAPHTMRTVSKSESGCQIADAQPH